MKRNLTVILVLSFMLILNCKTKKDDNLGFLALLGAPASGTEAATTPAAAWTGTRQLGVAAQDTSGYSAATDVNGNVYVAGFTTGGLDGNTLTGATDFFVTKYNSAGMKQ